MRHNTRQSNARRVAAAVAVAAALVPVGAALATPAQAANKTAVIDPMLTIFEFGGTFGIQTGCPLITAAANDIAQRGGSVQAVSPVIEQIDTACSQIAAAIPGVIAQGHKSAANLSFINTFANPAISQFADAISSTGEDQGALIAPFGKTVAGLGGTINFFQGGK